MSVVLVNPAGYGARRVSRRISSKNKPRRRRPSATRRRNPTRKAAQKKGVRTMARAGRTKSGRLKKGYRLTKSGRVVKARKANPKRKTTRTVTRRKRNPKFGKKYRPRLTYTRKGWTVGKRSRTFKKKATTIRKNPKFQLKRVLSPNLWTTGLTDAGTLLLGVAGQNILKNQVTARILGTLGLEGQGYAWAEKALCVVNAALLGEATRVFVRKPMVAKLVFAGALFQVVKDTLVEFIPQTAAYLGGGWPGAYGMQGYMDESSKYSPMHPQSMEGFLTV